jgi:hypothetical protein
MPYQRFTPAQPVPPPPAPQPRPTIRLLRGEKVGPAFWTVASLFSLVVNVILIVVLVVLARQLFAMKGLVQGQVLGGLYGNFVKMDDAHIRTTIPIQTSVPAKFDLPLNTLTMVTLDADTVIPGATIYDLRAGPLSISSANANIILPAGTQLPVQLNLTVPVDQQIPVSLMVEVDIPLNQTELHEPFVGLQEVVKPYYNLLGEAPNSWQEALCGQSPSDFCAQIVP